MVIGEMESERHTEDLQHTQSEEDRFVWDESSKLYYHPRSGFYHDPNAGWYYSTRDGLYYKFQDGNYVLLDSCKSDQSETKGQVEATLVEPDDEMACEQKRDQNHLDNEDEATEIGSREWMSNEEMENQPPPSEWLEDTLIELYLSGYPSTASTSADVLQLPEDIEERDSAIMSADGKDGIRGQGDGEGNMDYQTITDSSGNALSGQRYGEGDIDYQATTDSSVDEGTSWDEENWRAQYGQVIQEEAELGSGILAVDLWDWSLVKETQQKNHEVMRLVGKVVRPSSKLHPSVTSGGRRLRTAPICKVHLDLVQVRSGQLYKLRSPNTGYLATLSSYDASNPTKDWGFLELDVETIIQSCDSKAVSHQNVLSYSSSGDQKNKAHEYRDRAAERRALHGGFGVGPGQKRSINDADPPSPPPVEVAAAEALEMSFGSGSYAHKILKNMGWKEGQALGKTQQGLREPLQGVVNKGTAGLGWDSQSGGRR